MSRKKSSESPETLSQELKELFDASGDDKPLASVIVAGAFIDDCLRSLIRSKFIEDPKSEEIFATTLGAFTARAHLAFCLGLIEKPLYLNILAIAKIRNEFAHSRRKTFDDPQVIKLCLELKPSRASRGKITEWAIRSRFQNIAIFTAVELNLKALAAHHG